MLHYYVVHVLWNQLRRFMRTWAFPATIVFLFLGGVAYGTAGWYYERIVAANPQLPQNLTELAAASGLNTDQVLELGVGLFSLFILVVQVIAADKSVSRLFMQADVNLLFASDRSPQEVLCFRIANTLEFELLVGLVLVLRVPVLVLGQGMSLAAACAFPLGWCALLAFSALLKILIYELGSVHPLLHRNLRWLIFAALSVLGVCLYRSFQGTHDVLLSAYLLLGRPQTRWVPIWGWAKGIMLFGMEGDLRSFLLVLAFSLALVAVLSTLVMRLPADYYEQALAHAEEMARIRAALTSEGASVASLLSPRSREVANEGFSHGRGAGMYFFRLLHGRHRLGRLRPTRTMLTYLCVALASGLFARLFLDTSIDYIPVLVLGALVFFRTIFSSVTEDLHMPSYLLQPDSIWLKLLCSLAGGSCNCALDVWLPLMVGRVAAGFDPWTGLACVPVLATADFLASASGAFVEVSMPAAIGVGLKQIIQMLLVYVGWIFDGLVLTYGIAIGNPWAGFIALSVCNILLGMTFLGFAGVWLHPSRGLRPRLGTAVDERGARQAYSRVGLALAAMFVAIHAGQALLARVGDLSGVLVLHLPIYGMGLPLFLLVVGAKPLRRPDAAQAKRLPLRTWLACIPVCLFVMYTGNILGLALQAAMGALVPFSLGLTPTVAEATGTSAQVQTVLLVVAAPVMEELVFRRCVIERLLPYGERTALISSALLFALFHGSVSQVLYAFLLGLVFGYLYLRTRRLRYTMALHVLINAMTVVALPTLLEFAASSVSVDQLAEAPLLSVIGEPGVLALLAYLVLLLVLSLLGAVLFALGVRERELSPDGIRPLRALRAGGMIAFLGVGMIWLLVA